MAPNDAMSRSRPFFRSSPASLTTSTITVPSLGTATPPILTLMGSWAADGPASHRAASRTTTAALTRAGAIIIASLRSGFGSHEHLGLRDALIVGDHVAAHGHGLAVQGDRAIAHRDVHVTGRV